MIKPQPAFPEAFWPALESDFPSYYAGMTLRDWFAGQAMRSYRVLDPSTVHHDVVARHAYAIADAMLKARNDPHR